MKGLILFLLLICSISAIATDHFVKGDGSADFTTIAQVNAHTFAPGDRVFFNRGETFTGTLTINQSGTSGNPIIYGAYGTGANPIITGFTAVSSWTNLGSNIWESTSAVSVLTNCNMVSINGVNTPMGRTPNLGTYYTVTSHSANASITSSGLTGTPNWTGAEVVTRKERWIWQVGQINSQSSDTISYTDDGVFLPRDGWGFFIQDDVRTLDVQNEWYYNPSTKKISVYSTSSPTNVFISSSEYAVNSISKSYVTVENLTLIGANTSGVNIYGGSYFSVLNCKIDKCGYDGVALSYSNYTTIDSNVIKNINYSGVYSYGHADYETITNNTIDSTYLVLGIGRLYAGSGIVSNGDHVTINYNSVDHSGYNGIFPACPNGTVKNNFVNNSILNRGDGGGIYTSGNHTNLVLDGNIVLNTVGYATGIADGDVMSHGIYLDMPSTNVTIQNNTSANNTGHGIFLNQRSSNNTVTYNTSFANGQSQFCSVDYTSSSANYNNVVTNNIFVSKASSVYVSYFQSSINDIPGFFSSMDNNIYARPIDDNVVFTVVQPSEYGSPAYKTLAQWKTFSSVDANSTGSPFAVSLESYIRFEYNETASIKPLTFSENYRDIVTNQDHTTYSLPAYSSMIFLKHAAYPGTAGRKVGSYHGQTVVFHKKALKM